MKTSPPQTQLSPIAHSLKEHFYYCGMKLLSPVLSMITDDFPPERREPTIAGMKNPEYDKAAAEEYQKRYSRSTKLLKEQRNSVSKFLRRYEFSRGEHTDNEAIGEVKSFLVDGALDRLYEVLVAWSPMLVERSHIKPLQDTLKRILDGVEGSRPGVKQFLTDQIIRFNAEYGPGVLSMARIYDGSDDWLVPPMEHIPESSSSFF